MDNIKKTIKIEIDKETIIKLIKTHLNIQENVEIDIRGVRIIQKQEKVKQI